MRPLLLSIAATASILAIVSAGGQASPTEPGGETALAGHGSSAATASAKPSTPYTPGTNFIVGRLVRQVGNSVVLATVEHGEVEVDLSRVVDVWRETSVPASSLRPKDNLSVNGFAGKPFVARYVYANIGRMDGVVRATDSTGMLVEVQSRGSTATTLRRIDFSAYIEYGAPPVNITRADLVVGRQIGAVIYAALGETPRATRIW